MGTDSQEVGAWMQLTLSPEASASQMRSGLHRAPVDLQLDLLGISRRWKAAGHSGNIKGPAGGRWTGEGIP